MKVLILVHIEESFRKNFPPGMLNAIVKAIDKGEYDRVYHFTSQVNDDKPVEEIADLMDQCFDWGWGYEPECFEHQPEELPYVIPSHGHDYTWIPPELRKSALWLQDADVTLGGGCDGECLADMESVLLYLNIPFKRRRKFIY